MGLMTAVAVPATVGVGVIVGVMVGGIGVLVGMNLGVLVGGNGRNVPTGVWVATDTLLSGVKVAGMPSGIKARLARVGSKSDWQPAKNIIEHNKIRLRIFIINKVRGESI